MDMPRGTKKDNTNVLCHVPIVANAPPFGGGYLILDQSPSYQCLPRGRSISPSFTNYSHKISLIYTKYS